METTFARLVEHLAPRWLARLGRGLLGGCLGLGLAMGAGSVGAGVEMSGLGPLVLPELVGLSLPVKPNGAEATKAPLNPVAPTPDPAIRAKVQSNLGRQPLYFEPNLGQFDPEVKFLARGRGYNLFLTESEAVWVLSGERPIAAIEASNQAPFRGRHLPSLSKPTLSLSESPPAVLRMQFAGFPLPPPALVGSEPRPGVSHYYQGKDPAGWHTDVPRYGRVSYPEIYPGVELAFYEGAQGLEYDFRLAPGVDADVIRLSFEGADEVRTDEVGNLVFQVGGRELVHQAPKVYQEVDGERRAVAARYRTLGLSDGEAAQIAFAVAEHNLDVPLVIDPVVGTYFSQGGSAGYYDNEEGHGIAVDNDGNIYVTGFTDSADFPTLNAFDAIYGGGGDVFVTKFSPEGQILWSTYLGGSNPEQGFAIAIDSAGNVYTGGTTDSSDFPLLNAWDSTLDIACGVSGVYGGGCLLPTDAFVAKFSKDGELLWSTYLGGGYQPQGWVIINDIGYYTFTHASVGPGSDWVSGIAVDNSGNVYVAGGTMSTDFPLLNAQDASYGRLCYLPDPKLGECDVLASDAFVAKFNTHGQLLWSTYLGGSGNDVTNDVAIDGAGNVYVAGYTSDFCPGFWCDQNAVVTYSEDFPILNAWDSSRDGYDAFVTKLSPGGQLLWSTYLGGSFDDWANSIAVDGTGNVYVTGETGSTDFPRLNAADVMVGGGPSENDFAAFITKFSSEGQVLWSLRLGGSNEDGGTGIAVDNVGDVYVTGATASVDFPTLDAWVATFPEPIFYYPVYVSKFNQDGQMLWSTYAGLWIPNYTGVGHNIAVDNQGAVYVTAAGDNGEGPAAFVLKLAEALPQKLAVFIPGFLAARLYKGGSFEKLWESTCNEDVRYLELNPDGTPNPARPVILGDSLATDRGVIDALDLDPSCIAGAIVNGNKMYRYLIDLLDQEVGPEHWKTVPWDWRMSVEGIAENVKASVDSLLASYPGRKVTLIAHSTGGLVARSYLKKYGSSSIEQFISVAVPHLGTPNAILELLHGDQQLPFNGFIPRALWREVGSRMHVTHELLPTARSFDAFRPYGSGPGPVVQRKLRAPRAFFGAETCKPYALPLNGHNRHDAFFDWLAGHTDMANPTHPEDWVYPLQLGRLNFLDPAVTVHAGPLDWVPDIPVTLIYGEGVLTLSRIRYSKTVQCFWLGCSCINKPMYELEKNLLGDGTVPAWSAGSLQSSMGSNVEFFPVELEGTDFNHASIFGHPAVQTKLIELIHADPNLLRAAQAIPHQTVSALLSDAIATTLYSVYGTDVELHVYDSENRHTGPLSGGGYEAQIPESSYHDISSVHQIWVPGPATGYRAEIRSLITNNVVDIQTESWSLNGEEAIDEALFPYQWLPQGCPLAIEAIGGGSASETRLLLDNNCDGQTDNQLVPATLYSLDVQPPTGGRVQTQVPAIDCGDSCYEWFVARSEVVLEAVAEPGYHFSTWGGDCTGGGTCTLTMDGDKGVSAIFLEGPAPTKTYNGQTDSGTGEGTAAIENGGAECGFDLEETRFETAGVAVPTGLTFPHGLFHFRLVGCDPGSMVTLKVRWPVLSGAQYWKYNQATAKWYPYPGASFDALTGTWTFQITDNGPHDADPTPGSILDPAGPARVTVPGGGSGQSANPIPTLSPWMLLALVGLLGVLVLGVHRARRTLGL